jgi:hypothetical protein
VNVEPEQGIHKTIKADEEEDSSQESSNKSSGSSKIEENEESVSASKDTPEGSLDNNQPDEPQEPPVTRARSGRTIQQPRHFVEDISAGVFEALIKLNKDIINVWKKWDAFLLDLWVQGFRIHTSYTT